MRISRSVDIARPPGAVFPWVAEPEKAKLWMTSVAATEIVHRTPEMVGTTFRETVADETGSTELAGTVTGYVPDESIAFHLEGRYNVVDVEYRLVELPTGTRLTQTADVRFKPLVAVMTVFSRGKMREKLAEETDREFAALKDLCERSA